MKSFISQRGVKETVYLAFQKFTLYCCTLKKKQEKKKQEIWKWAVQSWNEAQ